MAAPLSRLTRNLLSKNHLQLSRLTAFPFTENYFQVRDTHSRRYESPNSEKTVKNLLTYTALISGCGYILYKWKSSAKSLKNSFSIVPSVYALSGGISHNRDKYNFIADVVEISAPSVVYIEIEDRKRVDFITGKAMIVSNGSGFIVGEDGLILTNAHVVVNKPHTMVKVRLHDGNTYNGAVENVDLQSDLATVRIPKSNLPVMKLGSSSSIRPGEFVVAIGSPLSLSNTITSGVVSSASRHSKELGLHNKHMDYIQTDAAVTFGNSGGPLVNLNGEAIGINAMKITPGISFAIPIDYAKEFLKKAESRRKSKVENTFDTPKRRYLGITMLTLTPDIIFVMQQRGGNVPVNVRHGVLVWKVMIGSPAYNAGLQPGDIITHVNGEPVVSATNIYKVLEKAGALKLTVARRDDIFHLEIQPEDV